MTCKYTDDFDLVVSLKNFVNRLTVWNYKKFKYIIIDHPSNL